MNHGAFVLGEIPLHLRLLMPGKSVMMMRSRMYIYLYIYNFNILSESIYVRLRNLLFSMCELLNIIVKF